MTTYTPVNPEYIGSVPIVEASDLVNAEHNNIPLRRLMDNIARLKADGESRDFALDSNQAEEYDAVNGTYAVGAIRKHGGKVYKCNTAIATPEAWDATKWDETTLGEVIENAGGGAEDVGLSVVDGKVCITYEV